MVWLYNRLTVLDTAIGLVHKYEIEDMVNWIDWVISKDVYARRGTCKDGRSIFSGRSEERSGLVKFTRRS